MRRRLALLVLAIGLLTATACSNEGNEPLIKDKPVDEPAAAFNLDDYKVEMNSSHFSSRNEGFVPNKEAAAQIAEVVLNQIYGAARIVEEKPLIVQFDPDQKVWLVQGTLPDGMDGGVGYVLLQQKDGKILSVWHDK